MTNDNRVKCSVQSWDQIKSDICVFRDHLNALENCLMHHLIRQHVFWIIPRDSLTHIPCTDKDKSTYWPRHIITYYHVQINEDNPFPTDIVSLNRLFWFEHDNDIILNEPFLLHNYVMPVNNRFIIFLSIYPF